MDASPLAKLPAELRNDIYELVLHEPNGFILHHSFNKYESMTKLRSVHKRGQEKNDPKFLAITEVCREMRKETSEMFYSINTFLHPMNRHRTRLIEAGKWLTSIGPVNSAAISRYEIDIGAWHVPNWRPMADRIGSKGHLINDLLRPSAIVVSLTMDLGWVQTTFPPSKRPACLRTGGHLERTVKFTIPNDREKAEEAVERTCREKLKELEKHADHRDCRVLADLEKCRRRLPLLFGAEREEKQYRRRLMLLSWKEEDEEEEEKEKESGNAENSDVGLRVG